MERTTYPLSLPDDLHQQLSKVATEAGLSLADVLRQAAKLGLPDLESRLCPPRLKLFFFKADKPKHTCLVLAGTAEEARKLLPAGVEQLPADQVAGVFAHGRARLLDIDL
jgi:hypothetical protein